MEDIKFNIDQAYQQIKNKINLTEVIEFPSLNYLMNNRILFKLESHQRTGSFKYRGALNAILTHLNNGQKIKQIFAFSSGNHAIALAKITKDLGIKCNIFLYNQASAYKIKLIQDNGASIHVYPTRQEAEAECYNYANANKNSLMLPPSHLLSSIYGQATILYEAHFIQKYNPDYVFVPCGGGGLCAGSLLTAQIINEGKTKIIALEPENADKAIRSFRQGSMYKFDHVVDTIADGARPLSLSENAYSIMNRYHKSLEIYPVKDKDIIRWTHYLDTLNLVSEPTSSMAFAGLYNYLRANLDVKNKEIMVIITGQNYNYKNFISTKIDLLHDKDSVFQF